MEKTITLLKEHLQPLLEEDRVVIIAIDGSCTAGKSTLAAALAKEYDCNVFHMDDYFLQMHQRTPERLAETGGNVDYERFLREVLGGISTGMPFAYRPYDCSTGSLKERVWVQPKQLNIVEGTYSHHPYFGDVYDLRIYLTVEDALRTERIKQRPAFLQQRFFEVWIPMEQRYFKELEIPARSHLVLDTNG